MADNEEGFGLQNSPNDTDSKDLHESKSEKQNGNSSKSPSSQTTYIQQVRVGCCVRVGVSACALRYTEYKDTDAQTACV